MITKEKGVGWVGGINKIRRLGLKCCASKRSTNIICCLVFVCFLIELDSKERITLLTQLLLTARYRCCRYWTQYVFPFPLFVFVFVLLSLLPPVPLSRWDHVPVGAAVSESVMDTCRWLLGRGGCFPSGEWNSSHKSITVARQWLYTHTHTRGRAMCFSLKNKIKIMMCCVGLR